MTSESSSEELFPALHLRYKMATSESSSEKLFPLLHLHYKLATSDISPAFRAFDAHDLRRGLRRTNPTRNLTCVSRPRRARSPQRVARDKSKTQSHLHFAHSTRTISAEGCAGQIQNAISPAFRALDTHDLRRGLRRTGPKHTLACISRPRHARSRAEGCTAPSTRTISAEGCVSWCSGGAAPGLKRESTEEREVKM